MSESGKGGQSGRWVVAMLLLAGVVGAAIAYAWWSHQQAGWQRQGVPPKEAAGSSADAGALADEVKLVVEQFSEAVEKVRPLEPVRAAAQRLCEKYPQSADARRLMGEVLLAMEDKPAAYEQFRLSLALDGRQPEVEVLAGIICEERGDLDKALVHYHSAVTLEPTSARYLTFLGNAYALKGERAKAMTTVLEAISIDSSHHRAYGVLANLFAQDGKNELAMQQIDKAIEHVSINERPAQVGYLRFKAMLLRRDNRPEESLQLLTQALLPAEQADKAVLPDIATTWGMLGQPLRAAELYEQTLALDPTRWELLVDAAQWRIKAGDLAAARLHIDALRKLQPNHPALNDLMDSLANAAAAAP